MHSHFLLLFLSLFLRLVGAQSGCENYGVANGSSCACPAGFGGATCSLPGCGGDIFQGSSRSLAQASSSSSLANLTSSSCSCEDGWGGMEMCWILNKRDACPRFTSLPRLTILRLIVRPDYLIEEDPQLLDENGEPPLLFVPRISDPSQAIAPRLTHLVLEGNRNVDSRPVDPLKI